MLPAPTKADTAPVEQKLPQMVTEAALLHPLWEDLAAHYGSVAVARGAAKPLGPSFRGHQARKEGRHSGRARSIWCTRAVRRMWCAQCGVPRIAGRTTEVVTVRSARTDDQTKSKREVVCKRCLRRTLPYACDDKATQAEQRSILLPSTAVRDCLLKRHRRKRARSKVSKQTKSNSCSARVTSAQKQQAKGKSSLLAAIPKVSARSARGKQQERSSASESITREPVALPSTPAPPKSDVRATATMPSRIQPLEAMPTTTTVVPSRSNDDNNAPKKAAAPLLNIPSISRKPNKDKSGKSGSGEVKKEVANTSAECKLAKVALMTISLWFMAWTPYLVINYTGVFEGAPLSPIATIWGSLFAKANAVYNPIVYGISHPKYQAALYARFPSLACQGTPDDSGSVASATTAASEEKPAA
uniref:Opsin n=1 Tax=Conopomorpha sinensis TaxID=940481 RepID=A0AAU8BC24_9NEOP